MNNLSKKISDFTDYVMEFYGKDGLYPMGVSRDDVLVAVGMRVVVCRAIDTEFHGDSFDREEVRELLIKEFGYEWPTTIKQRVSGA